jgi:hypothetical protein
MTMSWRNEMPSLSTLHWQGLRERGEVPDLYCVFGKFQVFLTPRVGSDVAQQALRELANVIGLPTWVITPEMLGEMWECEYQPRSRKDWDEEREYVSEMISIFWVDITFWADCVALERRSEIEEALQCFSSKIRAESSLFQNSRRRRKRRTK